MINPDHLRAALVPPLPDGPTLQAITAALDRGDVAHAVQLIPCQHSGRAARRFHFLMRARMRDVIRYSQEATP